MVEFDKHIVDRARKLDVSEWLDTINLYQTRIINGDELTVSGWYLTDLRHISNLCSPQMQGFINEDTTSSREDALNELGNDIEDWINDNFFDGTLFD